MVDAGTPGRPGRAPERSAYRPLRLIMIVFVLLIAASVGFHFKSQANSGSEPSGFSGQPPQYINIYVSGPDVRISDVTVTLGQGWFNQDYDRYGPVELRAQGFTGRRPDGTGRQVRSLVPALSRSG